MHVLCSSGRALVVVEAIANRKLVKCFTYILLSLTFSYFEPKSFEILDEPGWTLGKIWEQQLPFLTFIIGQRMHARRKLIKVCFQAVNLLFFSFPRNSMQFGKKNPSFLNNFTTDRLPLLRSLESTAPKIVTGRSRTTSSLSIVAQTSTWGPRKSGGSSLFNSSSLRQTNNREGGENIHTHTHTLSLSHFQTYIHTLIHIHT